MVPMEDDIEEAMKILRRKRSRGPLGMRSEHLKGWLAASKHKTREVAEKGEGKTDDEEGGPTKPHLERLVELIQTAFREGGRFGRGGHVASGGSDP